MAKLHELLAAEKTPSAAWNALYEDTQKKFKNPTHFFDGHSKSLTMIEDSDGNRAIEAQAREEKPVVTTVYETLAFALDLFGRAEDLQYQKNDTNRRATGTVMWKGSELLVDMPVDELLGLEARLTKLRLLFADVPTLDATKHWMHGEQHGMRIWEVRFPEDTTKTEKRLFPVVLKDATKEHPAQVQAVQRDEVIGKYTTTRRSGAATALQKADGLKIIDELIVQIKQARMRANETVVEGSGISEILLPILLSAFATSAEDHG
jgi:hypothetical protein